LPALFGLGQISVQNTTTKILTLSQLIENSTASQKKVPNILNNSILTLICFTTVSEFKFVHYLCRKFIFIHFYNVINSMRKHKEPTASPLFLLSIGILIIAFMIWSRFSNYKIATSNDVHVTLDFLLLITLCILLIYFFISRRNIVRKDIMLQRLREKISHVTENDSIITLQYDVSTKKIIRWNDTIGEPARIFSLNDYLTHIYPDDLPLAQKAIEYVNSCSTNKYICEYRYRLPEAKDYIWQYNTFYPFEIDKQGKATSYICISRNNTQWHEMLENLEQYRRRVSFISESIDIIIMQYNVDSDSFNLLDNKGKLPDRIVKPEYVENIIHPDDSQTIKDFIRRIKTHEEKKMSFDFRLFSQKTNSYTWFHNETVAFNHTKDGEISSYMCLNINNDNWHKTMLEMTNLSKKAEFLKMISGFLWNMGRKVRTPLNAVMGFSDVMSDEESGEVRKEYRKIVDENSALILRMADDMLTLSQIESGNLVFERETFEISQYFDNLLVKIRKTIRPNVNIRFRPTNGMFKVKLDPEKLDCIVSTLLNYFASYNNGKAITVDYSIHDGGLMVVVSDPTFVIENEGLSRIFDLFDNFDRSSKYIPGIGLPICKAILSKNNGKIIANSDPANGTVFSFWIPCETFYES